MAPKKEREPGTPNLGPGRKPTRFIVIGGSDDNVRVLYVGLDGQSREKAIDIATEHLWAPYKDTGVLPRSIQDLAWSMKALSATEIRSHFPVIYRRLVEEGYIGRDRNQEDPQAYTESGGTVIVA